MNRLGQAAGVAVALGSLAMIAFVVAPDDPAQYAADGKRSGADPVTPRPSVEPLARRLLERAATAPGRVGYSGTEYVTAWARTGATAQVLQVGHDPVMGTTYRSGRDVDRAAVQAGDSPAPSLLAASPVALLARHYSLASAGTGRVAGRPVDVVEARRPGPRGWVAARFWLDEESGLVLRREVYDREGRTTRATAFVDITVWPAAAGTADAADPQGWPEALDRAEVAALRARGWRCPSSLPGPLPMVDARRDGRANGALHLSYADGIASVSVFLQRGRLDRDRLDGYRADRVHGRDVWVRDGVPERVVWSRHGMVYTIVADASPRTVEQAVTALYPADGRGEGGLDRLGRGLDRVASWFNPMD